MSYTFRYTKSICLPMIYIMLLLLLMTQLVMAGDTNYEKLRKKKEQERQQVQFAERKLRKCIHQGDIEKCLQTGDPHTREILLSVYIKMMTPDMESDPTKLFK